jgi:four helix bundle protein
MSKFATNFKDLEIWKLAIEIAKRAYRVTQALPGDERYGLTSQMRRAAISLSANIAEGFRRRSRKEFRQFLHIALGSSAELESYCELYRSLFNGDSPEVTDLLGHLDRFQRQTNSLIRTLK